MHRLHTALLRLAGAILVLGALALGAGPAHAIPAFARATGLGCPACHQSWPVLNDFGEQFRDRGYRVRGIPDEATSRSLDYFPIAVRTTLGYQVSASTNQVTDSGKETITTGGFAHPEADLLFGENLAPGFSTYIVVSGFGSDGTASLESAWARLNEVGGSAWANFKLGKLELDLPASEHRTYTLTAPYLIYHFHPDGSKNGLSIGDNQLGMELMGHSDGVGLRYSVALLTGNAGASGPLDAPGLYGHLTYTHYTHSDFVPRVRFGALGLVGWWPSTFHTTTPVGGGPATVPGTGTGGRASLLAGLEAHLTLGSLAHPFNLSAVWIYGKEDKELVESATQSPSYHGGFLEATFTPRLELTFYGRLDAAWTLQQATLYAVAGVGDQLGFTIGARYALWMLSWGAISTHVELGTVTTSAAASDDDIHVTKFLAGLDLAI